MSWVKQREQQDSKQEDKLKKTASIHGDSKYDIRMIQFFAFLLLN